ncbi:putative gustatory receptor 28b [Uranotaenia lowii]|uniref:putative gustatory receptor 28b n=1 Tax=Uranotaenia lowii TaxID=190385 RepID=UPI00247A856B|nr:putative gustatory receptor 28b [Uranotaenia lowii]
MPSTIARKSAALSLLCFAIKGADQMYSCLNTCKKEQLLMCLPLWIIPQSVYLICVLQYTGMLLLIKDRFEALNRTLLQIDSMTSTHCNSFGISGGENRPSDANHHPQRFGMLASRKMSSKARPSRWTHQMERHGEEFVERLNHLRQIYRLVLRLRAVIGQMNHSFGMQILILVQNHFVTLILHGYGAYSTIVGISNGIVKFDTLDKLFMALWIFYIFLENFILCYTSSATLNEVDKNAYLLHDAIFHNNWHSSSSYQMEASFRLNVTEWKPRLDSCGLFDINLALFYKIIAAVTTYLIILIQFDQLQSKVQ